MNSKDEAIDAFHLTTSDKEKLFDFIVSELMGDSGPDMSGYNKSHFLSHKISERSMGGADAIVRAYNKEMARRNG